MNIKILGLALLVTMPVFAGGQYIGSTWIPEGTCYNRLDIERRARKQYEDKEQKIQKLWNKARRQGSGQVDLGKVRDAANSALENAKNNYHKMLQNFSPIYCSE